jgi:hypothetical protein
MAAAIGMLMVPGLLAFDQSALRTPITTRDVVGQRRSAAQGAKLPENQRRQRVGGSTSGAVHSRILTPRQRGSTVSAYPLASGRVSWHAVLL